MWTQIHANVYYSTIYHDKTLDSLVGVTQWLECHSVHQSVTGSILVPGQGICER